MRNVARQSLPRGLPCIERHEIVDVTLPHFRKFPERTEIVCNPRVLTAQFGRAYRLCKSIHPFTRLPVELGRRQGAPHFPPIDPFPLAALCSVHSALPLFPNKLYHLLRSRVSSTTKIPAPLNRLVGSVSGGASRDQAAAFSFAYPVSAAQPFQSRESKRRR